MTVAQALEVYKGQPVHDSIYTTTTHHGSPSKSPMKNGTRRMNNSSAFVNTPLNNRSSSRESENNETEED